MTKILITGSNSFVGSNIVKFSGFKDIDEVSLYEKKPADIQFDKYDVVIHLVAIVHQTSRIPDNNYFLINRDLCFEVAQCAKRAGIKQFIFLSTVKVYGKFIPGSPPWNENSICHPYDAYGKSKYEAEIMLKEIEDEKFVVSIIRTPLVYGNQVKANMLGIIKLVSSFPILPFRDLQNRRNFTSAENLVAFIDRIIELRISGVFIAMDDEAISTSALVRIIAESLNKKIILLRLPASFINAGIYFFPRIFDRLYGSFEMDNSQTLRSLDFRPPVSIREGIKKMVLAFRNNNVHK
jgi:nucleoside-diphosphate-sugar epimerase